MIPGIANANPIADQEMRTRLLECYLDFSTSKELSEWLQNLEQDPRGSVEEKKARIREHTKYLSMSPETFPGQTINYLSQYSADFLADICQALGLDDRGGKNDLFRRIYREVGYREGWLSHVAREAPVITKETVLPFIHWYPILKNYDYEKDYYEDFHSEMLEVFGEANIHEQLPIAHGSTLKIDFHIGHPQQGGVGVEFKMPTSNSEIQRALGQMDQYLTRYGSELVIVLIPDFLQKAQETLFLDELTRKGITTVMKTKARLGKQ